MKMKLLKDIFTIFPSLILMFFVSRSNGNFHISGKTFRDLKLLMMYYNEPLLYSAKVRDFKVSYIKGAKFDGEDNLETSKSLIEAIERISTTVSNNASNFAKYLKEGSEFIQLTTNFDEDCHRSKAAKYLQTDLLSRLEKYKKIVIPFGWISTASHALCVIIEESERHKGKYDLTVCNTGDGLRYHHSSNDPNNVYPALHRLWVKFVDIPQTDIFPENAWFMYPMFVFKWKRVTKEIESVTGSVAHYFYGSILANFTEYVEKVKEPITKLFPAQRSGSCSMSSLVAAHLYFEDNEVEFLKNRIYIGHEFLNNFMKTYKDNSEFKSLITDGFDLTSRGLFKSLISSLAHQLFSYLEYKLPNSFMHASLIGLNRADWIKLKKGNAINDLTDPKNFEALQLIRNTIKIATELEDFLKNNPINPKSNMIKIDEDFKKNKGIIPKDYYNFKQLKFDHVNLFDNLKTEILRPNSPLEDFTAIYERLIHCKNKSEIQKFICIKDTFERAGNRWWKVLDSSLSEKNALQFTKICGEILVDYLKAKNITNTFDDLVMLAHLQIGLWKSAVEYDKLIGESHNQKLHLERFNPPNALGDVLKQIDPSITSGSFENYSLQTSFSAKNFQDLNSLLKEYCKLTTGEETFFGPKQYLPEIGNSQVCNTGSLYKSIKKTTDNNNLYTKMLGNYKINGIIIKILNELKNNPSSAPLWSGVESAEFTIFLSILGNVKYVFPHFVEIIKGTMAIYKRTGQSFYDGKSTRAIGVSYDDENDEYPFVSNPRSGDSIDVKFKPNKKSFEKIRNCHNIKIFNKFYDLRHSQAQVMPESHLNFESWLNYLKGYYDGTIFDDYKFGYLSDHILNMPRLEFNDKGEIDTSNTATYCKGFTKKHAKETFKALMKLINTNIGMIIEGNKIHYSQKVLMLNRAVDIGIILTRFIGRLDYDNFTSGENCAKMLASLYTSFFRICKHGNSYEIDNNLISKVNLVLTQICDIPLRNPKTFLLQIQNIMPEKLFIPFRRSLARIHWFITKIYYEFLKLGDGLQDDLFNNGFVYHPISLSEVKYMNYLLVELFLKRLVPDCNKFDAHFSDNGDICVFSPNGADIDADTFFIQFSSGIVLINESQYSNSVNKNQIVTSKEFKKYFDGADDYLFACRGELTMIGNLGVYIVSDFKRKGNNIVIIHLPGSVCRIFRKLNNFWYEWSAEINTEVIRKSLQEGYESHYRSIKNPDNRLLLENFIVKKDDDLPLFIFRPAFFNYRLRVGLPGFTDYWEILDYWHGIVEYERHLELFTPTHKIFARSDDGELVVIYPFLRLAEDPKTPLVLVQNKQKINDDFSELKVLNSPGLSIHFDQVAIRNFGIEGTLVTRNKDNQLFILAPLIYFDTEKESKDSFFELWFKEKVKVKFEKIQNVEKIPIVRGYPAPQTIRQKLILAYYCVQAREFDFARELLNPNTSINQNDVFNIEELNILYGIAHLKQQGPEINALKIMAYMHSFINSRKFPLAYIVKENEKNIKSDLVNLILKELEGILSNYFMSIRELSEKYYVHQIFPEFLDAENIENIQAYVGAPLPIKPMIQPRFELNTFEGSNEENVQKMKFERLSGETIKSFINMHKFSSNQEPLRELLDIKTKLLHRTVDNGNTLIFKSNEVFLLCAALRPEIIPNTLFYSNDNDELKTLLDTIRKENPRKFAPINAEDCSTITPVENIFATLKADLKIKPSPISTHSEFNFRAVKESDKDKFSELRLMIDKSVSLDRTKDETEFSHVHLSKVLENLKDAMDRFVMEKGQYLEHQIKETEGSKFISLLNGFIIYLQTRLTEIQDEFNKIASDLATKAYDPINVDSIPHYIDTLNRFKHGRKMKRFESLYSCYQRMSVDCIQNKFPQLNFSDCETLLEDSFKYYSLKALYDYMEFLISSVNKMLESRELQGFIAVDDLLLLSDEIVKIDSFDEKIKTPSILNFEYRSRLYRLRKEQVDDINDLTKKDEATERFNSIVIQRMMAAGKTLVLGTISVVKKALDSSKLSVLVPPSSLYQSNLSGMQARTYDYFKTMGHNFKFPRFQFDNESSIKDIIVPYLKLVLKKIENTKKANDYLVLSPETLQAFLNSYIEMINYQVDQHNQTSSNTKQVLEALKLFAAIYDIFRNQTSIILDEIDMTMDPKKELNFPTTETEPIDILAAVLSADLIEFSIFDKEIKTMGLDIRGNNQSALTDKNYGRYQKALIDYIEKQLDDKDTLWAERLLNTKFPELTKRNIVDFLSVSEMSHMNDWIKILIDAGCVSIANSLIIIKLQIHQNFKHAMKSTTNLNFGTAGPNRAEVEYAIPYLAANTPSPNSEFADRWETLNKTLLMLSSAPCSEQIAKKMIIYSKKKIISESDLNTSIEETTTYFNVKTLLAGYEPMHLDASNVKHVKALHNALKILSPAAIRLLFSYAIDEIIRKMQFPVEQITCNALNMVSMFQTVQGYSGTIDNVNILPKEVIYKAYKNHIDNEICNGAIALKLIKDSTDNGSGDKAVPQISDAETKLPVADLIKLMIDIGLSNNEKSELTALIDAGAFFKNFTNEQVATSILDVLYPRIRTVLYYDEESNQIKFKKWVNEAAKENGYISKSDPASVFNATQTDIIHRFTFYDQRHITGSDILQPISARALMTINTRILLRDILQGTLRMRQFMTSQRVHLITSNSAARFYFSKVNVNGEIEPLSCDFLSVKDILTLGALNEDEKQLMENEKLAFVKIDNEVRRFVMDEITTSILQSNEASKTIAIWFSYKKNGAKYIRDLFIRATRETPVKWIGQMEEKEATLVLSNYASFWIKKLKNSYRIIKSIDNSFDQDLYKKKFLAFKTSISNLISDESKFIESKESVITFLRPKIANRTCGFSNEDTIEKLGLNQNLKELDIKNLMENIYNTTDARIINRNTFHLLEFTRNSSNPSFGNIHPSIAKCLLDVLLDNSFSKTYIDINKNALIEPGKNIGVSTDLIEIAYTMKQEPKIFTKLTWEGSHILVQQLPETKDLRFTLLSTESANEAFQDLMSDFFIWSDSEPSSTFWICDLSGDISASNKVESDGIVNIMEKLPQSRIHFFNLLIFNGSLSNILGSKYLKSIYFKKWLNENRQERAIFLLLRMTALAEKHKNTLAENDPIILDLIKVSRGDTGDLSPNQSSSGYYSKPRICKDLELMYNPGNVSTIIHDENEKEFDIINILREISGDPNIIQTQNNFEGIKALECGTVPEDVDSDLALDSFSFFESNSDSDIIFEEEKKIILTEPEDEGNETESDSDEEIFISTPSNTENGDSSDSNNGKSSSTESGDSSGSNNGKPSSTENGDSSGSNNGKPSSTENGSLDGKINDGSSTETVNAPSKTNTSVLGQSISKDQKIGPSIPTSSNNHAHSNLKIKKNEGVSQPYFLLIVVTLLFFVVGVYIYFRYKVLKPSGKDNLNVKNNDIEFI